MLIKRVVIQGFKTFAKRTEFVFDPGITAVVGPNGSGKSNIVDAVRWCLGEQSFGLLRSKKTSDIIFSGSDKKARLGMAQPPLTQQSQKLEREIGFAVVQRRPRKTALTDAGRALLEGAYRILREVDDTTEQAGCHRTPAAL